MAGPQDPAAAGGDQLRAAHADREQVIEALKVAFVYGRLTRDELDVRVSRALTARTRADLAALAADIPAVPSAPAAAGLARAPVPARRWPLARAAAKSGGCLVFAFALVLFAANVLDPHGLGNRYHPWSALCAVVAWWAVIAAICIMGVRVAASPEQRRSRRQLPLCPGPGGHALEAGPSSGTGHDLVPPGPRTDQTRADLRSDSSRPRRPRSSGRGARAPRGIRPVPGAV
jgi:Domain of unknown function (DUF1707)